VSHAIQPDRHVWLQVAEGSVTVNGQALQAGDGAALSEESAVTVEASGSSQVLLFDLN